MTSCYNEGVKAKKGQSGLHGMAEYAPTTTLDEFLEQHNRETFDQSNFNQSHNRDYSDKEYVNTVINRSNETITENMLSGRFLKLSEKLMNEMYKNLKLFKKEIVVFLKRFSLNFKIDIDFLFDLLYGIYHLCQCDSRSDFFLNMSYVIKTCIGIRFKDFKDVINKYVNNLVSSLKQVGQMRSESYFVKEDFSLKRFFDIILSAKVVQSLRTLVLNLVGLKFFKKETSIKFIKMLGPPNKISLLDFSYNICESIDNMINFCRDVYYTGSFMGALKRRDAELSFIESSYELTLEAETVYLGDDLNFVDKEFMKNRVSAKVFIDKIKKKIIEGDDIKRRQKTKGTFDARLYLLKSIANDILFKMQTKSRVAPFGVVIYGPPQIGKSSMLTHFYKLFCKHKGYVYSKDLVYDRNPKSSYWDNHDPLVQPIIHYPEIGSVSKNIAKNKGDETVDELLMVSDSQPFSAEKSRAEEKGKCLIMPELLTIDCNDPAMNLEVTNNNPAAIRRRFVYVEAEVRSEYRKENSNALDTDKVEGIANKMDLWNFRVYRQDPKNLKESTIVYYKNKNGQITMDIFDLSSLFMRLFEEHDQAQVKFKNAINETIDKYLPESIKSEGLYFDPKHDYKLIILCISSFFFPLIIPFIVLYFMFQGFVKYMYGILSFKVFFMLYALGFNPATYIRHQIDYKIESYKIKCKRICSYMWRWSKSKIISDPEFEEEKDFIKYDIFPIYISGLFIFIISISLLKIFFSFLKLLRTVTFKSESEIIESSNTFTPDNIDEHLQKVESLTACAFPLPKKKGDDDKNYDVVEQTTPRYVVDHMRLNNPEQIHSAIMKNVRFVAYQYKDGKCGKAHGIGLCGDFILLNNHTFANKTCVRVAISNGPKANNVKYFDVDYDYVIPVGTDSVIIRVFGTLFRDITPYLCNFKGMNKSFPGFLGSHTITLHQAQAAYPVNGVQPFILKQPLTYIKHDHKDGDCGLPIVAVLQRQTFLLGIHSAGEDGGQFCFGDVLNKDSIVDAIARNSNHGIMNIVSEGAIRLKAGSTLEQISRRSPLLFENTPGLNFIGHMTNFPNITPISRLQRTELIDKIEYLIDLSPYRSDGNLKYLPPLMKFSRINGQYIAPLNNFVKKVGIVKSDIDRTIMDKTIEVISSYLIKSLKEVGIDNLHPFSFDIAQNGFPENFYIRSMKCSTSGGVLLPGKKEKYCSNVELPFKKDGKVPNFIVKEQVMETISAYLKGENSYSLVGAQLKDEPRSYDKVQIGKTRVFAMSSYDMTLVNRMYLMPFYSLMCEHRDIFCTKVGINMHSSEAGDIYAKLSSFSNFVMEGDYGGYDTSMPVGIGLIANSIVYEVLKSFGYNDDALKIVKGILTDNLYPTICMEGNIFVAPGFQPSGKYATAEDNSLRGLALLVFSFIQMCTKFGEGMDCNVRTDFEPADFFKLFLPITYGDDMLCGVKSCISSNFNNVTYAHFVSRVFGMEFTSTEKTKVLYPFKDINHISFLKRTFKDSKLLNRKVAVLDKDSMVKSLTYVLPSTEVSVETQTVETMISVLRELFFYCDSVNQYNHYRFKFLKVVCAKTTYIREEAEKIFPTAEQLLEAYL